MISLSGKTEGGSLAASAKTRGPDRPSFEMLSPDVSRRGSAASVPLNWINP
jgi:hypothetical protein